jgi:hypothetical protein
MKFLKFILLSSILAGCATISLDYLKLDELYGKITSPNRLHSESSPAGIHYQEAIKPIIEQRCVVCHGCYDAPCQLKLSSPAGIERGASKERVYDGTRILAGEPSRLGVDAQTTEQWRRKDFFPVLNERSQTETFNLERSLLYKMIKLKQQHPASKDKLLNDDISLGLDREQVCASIDEFNDFAEDNPSWGMPYGLPSLSKQEYNSLTQWLKSGSAMSHLTQLPPSMTKQIKLWEDFFNSPSLKHQLTSRYIYEHLFLANIYFSDTELFSQKTTNKRPDFFFKLVRSSTPAPLEIQVLNSRRPYDAPKDEKFFYRLMPNNESIVSKTHMPYAFNQQRLDWIKQLFIEPDYQVESLPSYQVEIAANPLLAFKDLPIESRYRFMLEEAEFTIMGFIKGPVCRGQVALNVIDDHFWVTFVDPKLQASDALNNFLVQQADNLRLPGEEESNSGIITSWVKYSNAHNRFLEAKNQAIANHVNPENAPGIELIWDGDGKNPNAALTIFRHFDSSTVVKGLVGQNPKTAWVIGYPLLERIHYLLVAEFDVYGNIGHQLMTRLYMDFLRMEGEYNFLGLLPQDERKRLADHWYRDTSDRVKAHLFNSEQKFLQEPQIAYSSKQPKLELLQKIKQRLAPVLSHQFDIHQPQKTMRTSSILAKINRVNGQAASLLPEISYITLIDNLGGKEVFTLLKNTGHSNISSLLAEDDNLLPEEDYLTLVSGIVGSYPSALFRVNEFRLQQFVEQLTTMEDEEDYEKLADSFAIRRTDDSFWRHSDELHHWFNNHQPLQAGLLDYNRLENR